MNGDQSKSLFTKLKETCKKIDQGVSNIKKKMNEGHEKNASDLAAKTAIDFQEKIRLLKTEVSQIIVKLEPQLDRTTDFIEHFTEVVTETDISVTNLENFLAQYGYKPLTQSSNLPEKVSPVKEVSSNTEHLSRTPSLIEYGISSYGYPANCRSQLNERRSSFDDLAALMELKNSITNKKKSESTPTLDIDVELLDPKEEETPPMPHVSIPAFPSTPTLEL